MTTGNITTLVGFISQFKVTTTSANNVRVQQDTLKVDTKDSTDINFVTIDNSGPGNIFVSAPESLLVLESGTVENYGKWQHSGGHREDLDHQRDPAEDHGFWRYPILWRHYPVVSDGESQCKWRDLPELDPPRSRRSQDRRRVRFSSSSLIHGPTDSWVGAFPVRRRRFLSEYRPICESPSGQRISTKTRRRVQVPVAQLHR